MESNKVGFSNRTLAQFEKFGRSAQEMLEFAERLPERYFDQKSGLFKIDPTKAGSKADRENFMSSLIRTLYDFVRHEGSTEIIYYKKHSESDYAPLSDTILVNIVTAWYDVFFANSISSEVSSACKNIKNHITKTANIRNQIIKIMDNAYYNASTGELVNTYNDGCFCQLDGTNKAFKGSTKYIDIIKESFGEMKGVLEAKSEGGTKQFGQFYKDLPVNYEFVKDWANESVPNWQDRYWDIMTMFSIPFFRKMPKKIYDLNGKGRCGKSTALDLLKFEWGNLAASVRISDFDNRDVNNELAYCFINIPDEEKVSTTIPSGACANFKTLATHKGIYVGVKNKGPIWVDGQFFMVIAGNGAPKWPPKESEPCMQRIIFIKFTNFFGGNDTTDFDFIDDVIMSDPEMYARFIGERLAIANYFSESGRQLFISEDSRAANEYLSVDDNSIAIYHRMWNKYFDGVSNLEFHYEDYRNCCSAFGWVMQTKSEFRQTEIELHANKPVPIKLNGKSVRCVRVPKYKPASILYPDLVVEGHGTAGRLHEAGQSVVAIYEKAAEERRMKEMERKLDSQDEMLKYLGSKQAKALLGDDYMGDEDD